jgi:hypothetical protein
LSRSNGQSSCTAQPDETIASQPGVEFSLLGKPHRGMRPHQRSAFVGQCAGDDHRRMHVGLPWVNYSQSPVCDQGSTSGLLYPSKADTPLSMHGTCKECTSGHAAGDATSLSSNAIAASCPLARWWSRANCACSRNARTNLARNEALCQSRPVRRTNERSGSASLRKDNPSGHGDAQSGSSETPSPRSTN